MNLLSPQQVSSIIHNVLQACVSIEMLSLEAYHWLEGKKGFSPTINREDFIFIYKTGLYLKETIQVNTIYNTHTTVDKPDPDYFLQKQSCEMYQMILDCLEEVEKDDNKPDSVNVSMEPCGEGNLKVDIYTDRKRISLRMAPEGLLSMVNSLTSYCQTSEDSNDVKE